MASLEQQTIWHRDYPPEGLQSAVDKLSEYENTLESCNWSVDKFTKCSKCSKSLVEYWFKKYTSMSDIKEEWICSVYLRKTVLKEFFTTNKLKQVTWSGKVYKRSDVL